MANGFAVWKGSAWHCISLVDFEIKFCFGQILIIIDSDGIVIILYTRTVFCILCSCWEFIIFLVYDFTDWKEKQIKI